MSDGKLKKNLFIFVGMKARGLEEIEARRPSSKKLIQIVLVPF